MDITWEERMEHCSDGERQRLSAFFEDLQAHCQLQKKDARLLRGDFENAIGWYLDGGVPLHTALERLAVKHLGGFYARPPIMWFPLDDAAKIYPLSMGHGKMAMFRLSMYLKAPVVPELLQMALNFTIKRFPTFATTLKRGVFWHYLDSSKRRYCAELEEDIPCQPIRVAQSGCPTFRVLYFENRVSVEIFHVLADGTGGVTFLKVLMAEYLRLTGVAVEPDGSLWDVEAPPDPREFENAFAGVPKSEGASGFVDKPAVQLSGRLSDIMPCRLLHFKLPTQSLKAAAHRYGATVTTYLLALMFMAGRAACDELKGQMSIQLPVDMRKYYPSKTVRNFAMYCGIRLNMEELTEVEAIMEEISRQVKAKTAKEAMHEMVTSTQNMVGLLRYIPLLIKQPAAKVVYGFLGDKIFTTTLSNLGVVTFPPTMAPHIESMDFVLGSTVTNRVSCSLVTVNDTATFSISKITRDPSFEEKLLDLLRGDGVEVTVEGSRLYGR